MKDNPKFTNNGAYWNKETIKNIVDFLPEYQDLFSTTFAETKGIFGELGEMRISLKLYANPIKQRMYRMNPLYNHKVKEKIDRMLEVGIIEIV
jgi:hypothetical protein